MADIPEMEIPMQEMVDFLVTLLNTPSPTGYYDEVVRLIENAFSRLEVPGLEITRTQKGALILQWKGFFSDAPRGLTAHVDTLGLMVKEIKSNGTLRFARLGGITLNGIETENVTVRTFDGREYRGTVLMNNPSSHVNEKLTKSDRNEENMEIRLDNKTTNAEMTRNLGINVGDFVFVDPRVDLVDTGYIKSRFLDDKACIAILYGVLKAMKLAGARPAQDTTILIANYEEVGHGGAHGWPDNLAELLVLDMAAIGTGQASDEHSCTICAKDSGGPYHFEMMRKLRQLSEKYEIPVKIDIYPYYSSDGTAYWRAGGGARVGLIGPGVASSHSYERTHRDALYWTAQLTARYLLEP
ncbi:M42 family metallopeptidase [Anaerolineales bacterium]